MEGSLYPNAQGFVPMPCGIQMCLSQLSLGTISFISNSPRVPKCTIATYHDGNNPATCSEDLLEPGKNWQTGTPAPGSTAQKHIRQHRELQWICSGVKHQQTKPNYFYLFKYESEPVVMLIFISCIIPAISKQFCTQQLWQHPRRSWNSFQQSSQLNVGHHSRQTLSPLAAFCCCCFKRKLLILGRL